MLKYFVEIEFESIEGNKYWFPVIIETLSQEEAGILRTSLIKAIEEHYKLIKATQLRLCIEGFNSEYLDSYITNRLAGKLVYLQYNVWQFKYLKPEVTFSFNESLSLIDDPWALSDKNIAETVKRGNFPVRAYPKDNQNNSEFLMINIVFPS